MNDRGGRDPRAYMREVSDMGQFSRVFDKSKGQKLQKHVLTSSLIALHGGGHGHKAPSFTLAWLVAEIHVILFRG